MRVLFLISMILTVTNVTFKFKFKRLKSLVTLQHATCNVWNPRGTESKTHLGFVNNCYATKASTDLTCLLTYFLTYLLTYSMEQSPSWEANRFSPSQEIHRILWYPNVHYRIHNIPSIFRTLRQRSQFQTLHLVSRRPILILSSHLRPRSCKWSLSLKFTHHTLYVLFLRPQVPQSRGRKGLQD